MASMTTAEWLDVLEAAARTCEKCGGCGYWRRFHMDRSRRPPRSRAQWARCLRCMTARDLLERFGRPLERVRPEVAKLGYRGTDPRAMRSAS